MVKGHIMEFVPESVRVALQLPPSEEDPQSYTHRVNTDQRLNQLTTSIGELISSVDQLRLEHLDHFALFYQMMEQQPLSPRFGFGSIEVIGICLAFPFVLLEEGQVRAGRIEGLLSDLKLIFFDFRLGRFVEGDVDSWHDMCRKLRVFYDLNSQKGELDELIERHKSIFIDYTEEELVNKVDYFCRFSVKKEEVAQLILQCPKILKLDLEKPVFNVMKLLTHFGLSTEDMKEVSRSYGHVMGTNKMANLPNVMKALGLQEWFLKKIKDGNHMLLVDYIRRYPKEEQDLDYQEGLRIIRILKTWVHNIGKLNFLLGLGFGENTLSINLLNHLHGTSTTQKIRLSHTFKD
ncbi:transcription termination factor MTEF18, mitochondrial-like [Arachis duranensis]|uniref:Transcription termination factor MTEF18, mitochondrial-like n=1 Tax=Arachis duranensis TaxID=130453 RepID=A0A6P4B266_ARADU|nr:transcription termination factor MTEF18, mitochondrial-like [Arachis duranensis]